jgi:GNAT superfamily N-acetyltransferase
MPPTRQELAENTSVYALPQPMLERQDRGGFVYTAAPRMATVQRLRVGELEPALAWTREESRRRGHRKVEWWLGWSTEPADARDRLLELGLVPDEVPTLTGMTSADTPPAVAGVDVRAVTTLAELLAALAIDWEVWEVPEAARAAQAEVISERFDEQAAAGVTRHYAAFLEGERVGFARGVDLDGGVALFGGSVLPQARGRGVYRALVRARWEHAVARGTPLLVVQAGEMSAPVLSGLGFASHGEIQLLVDHL